MKTLIITKQDVPDLLPMHELIQETRNAYITHSKNKTINPQRTVTQIDDTSIVVNLPGYLPLSSMFTVKINAKSTNNPSLGLPFLIGTILLINQKTGELLAIMDSGLITAMRTGAAGAVGIECLANPFARKIALIGAGVQGEWQIRASHSIGIANTVYVYDIIESRAHQLAEKLSDELNISIHLAPSIKEAIDKSDIVVSTTQSKIPIITQDMLHPGLHINAFGADQPGKVEIDSSIIDSSLIVVDDKNLSLSDGTLNVAHKQELLNKKSILEIGNVLSKKSLGRQSDDQVTIFGNLGLAFQDLIACSIIYKNALKLGKGLWVDFDTSANPHEK